MAFAQNLSLIARGQLLRGERADRFQHAEARLACRAFALHDEIVLDQRCQAVQRIDAQLAVRVADRVGCFKGAAAGEDGQAAEERLFRLAQQAVAPGDRLAQGALAGRCVARATGEHIEAMVEPGTQRRGWQHPHPRGGQLDRERHAVEAAAHLRDRGRVLLGDLEVGLQRAGPLGEQTRCVGGRDLVGRRIGTRRRQARHREDALTVDT
ncbi:MAG TPA: hypothetical protein VH916_13515, partial [Dehalococcoidia bacterium]